MNTFKKILFLFFLWLSIVSPISGQENAVILQRTAEQEAIRQTEKLQQELNLTPEQAKQLYEINLRYERQRQVSNTRSQAMERVKNKNADIERILNEDQNNRLQNKRYERSTFEAQAPAGNRTQPANSSGFRSSSEYRANPSVRVMSTDINLRNTYRSTNTNSQYPQTVRRSTSVSPRSPQTQSNPAAIRSSANLPSTSTRTDSYSPNQNNSSTRSSQSAPTNAPRRAETPANSNRR